MLGVLPFGEDPDRQSRGPSTSATLLRIQNMIRIQKNMKILKVLEILKILKKLLALNSSSPFPCERGNGPSGRHHSHLIEVSSTSSKNVDWLIFNLLSLNKINV